MSAIGLKQLLLCYKGTLRNTPNNLVAMGMGDEATFDRTETNVKGNNDMDSPPLDKFKAIISITKNSKWIKKVTINWKDIAAYDGIKVEFKEKGY